MTDMQQLQDQLSRYLGFLQQDPDNINITCQVAQLQLQTGQISESRNTLGNLLKKFPNDAGLRFNLSNVLLAEAKYDDAISLLDELNQQHDNSAIKYNLALAHAHSLEFEQAADLFAATLDKDDEPADARYWLGRSYYYLGDIDKAEQYLHDHYKHNPDNQQTLGTLALLYMDIENLEKAREFAEKSLELNPDNTEAAVTLGNIFLEQNDEDKALEQFTHATDVNPHSGRAWSGLGLTHMLQLETQSAISELTKATELMPSHLGTWHALAWAQLVTDDVEGARKTFEDCMQVDHNFGETHGGLAVIDVIQGNKEAARQGIKRALKLDKFSFSARFAESLLIQDTRPERARKIIETIFNTQLSGGETLQQSLQRQMRKLNNKLKH